MKKKKNNENRFWLIFRIIYRTCWLQVAEVSVSQDQAAPVQVGDGQQTFRADKHTVRRGRRCGHSAVIVITANYAVDVAPRAEHGGAQENAPHAHVPGLVLYRRISGRGSKILSDSIHWNVILRRILLLLLCYLNINSIIVSRRLP